MLVEEHDRKIVVFGEGRTDKLMDKAAVSWLNKFKNSMASSKVLSRIDDENYKNTIVELEDAPYRKKLIHMGYLSA